MKNKLSLPTSLLMLSILLSSGCSRNKPPSAEVKPEEKADTPRLRTLDLSSDSAMLAQLKYAVVITEQFVIPIEVTGQVAINEDRSVRVGSLFTGRILEVPVRIGDRVQRGQPLAKMHTHEVHEAQAEYAKALAELNQRKKQAEFAKSLLDRAERLYQAKALSLNELERTKLEFNTAKEEVTRAEAERERAIGHREHLGLPDNLNYDQPVIVRAPAPGIVIKREITPGASVNPGDNLFFISDLSSVWIIAQTPEKNLSSLKIGARVQIKVAAYVDETFTGRITRIGEMLNPETRTVEVRSVVDNRLGKLKPEMFATISLAGSDRRDALWSLRRHCKRWMGRQPSSWRRAITGSNTARSKQVANWAIWLRSSMDYLMVSRLLLRAASSSNPNFPKTNWLISNDRKAYFIRTPAAVHHACAGDGIDCRRDLRPLHHPDRCLSRSDE
ncbi:MAG: efflux RND transporter periplasmic adaptor subunit [Acidobacteria bacterium]|nr:efflux RND transporter periplasmic adaptor subunit [Acidobacteriota bacterium]